FEPEGLSRPAPEHTFFQAERPAQRFRVHIRHHENGAILDVLDHGRYQPFVIQLQTFSESHIGVSSQERPFFVGTFSNQQFLARDSETRTRPTPHQLPRGSTRSRSGFYHPPHRRRSRVFAPLD